ncbi:hypothetical protein BGZ97_006930, partial [Linnemannia gamsii]
MIVNSPVRSLRHTVDGGSYPSTPEYALCSPPSPLDFNKTVEEEAQTQRYWIVAGHSIRQPSRRPFFAGVYEGLSFVSVQVAGSQVTELYESAKRKALLDHTHVDEIAQ